MVVGRVSQAGGIDGNSAPLLIKVDLTLGTGKSITDPNGLIYAASSTANNAAYELTMVGKSRIDGKRIFRVRGNSVATDTNFAQGETGYEPIYDAIAKWC